MLPVWDPGSSYNVVMTMRFCNIPYSCRVSSGNVPSTIVMCFYKSTLRFASVFCNVVSSRFCDRPLLCPATCADGSLGAAFFTTIVQWSSHPCLVTVFFYRLNDVPPDNNVTFGLHITVANSFATASPLNEQPDFPVFSPLSSTTAKCRSVAPVNPTDEPIHFSANDFTPTILNSSLDEQYSQDNSIPYTKETTHRIFDLRERTCFSSS